VDILERAELTAFGNSSVDHQVRAVNDTPPMQDQTEKHMRYCYM
jgi:hypothetical protein